MSGYFCDHHARQIYIFLVYMDLSLTYSFGGTAEKPLVKRTITFVTESVLEGQTLQEALLQRTDMLLDDLCGVFDASIQTLASSGFTDVQALNTAMGAVVFAVKNVIMQGPSTSYTLMYERTQQLLNLRPIIREIFGEEGAKTVTLTIVPQMEMLKLIDGTFAPA